MTIPKYRDDVKGNVKNIMLDCVKHFINEIRYSNHFILEYDDLDATAEYFDYLTQNELQQCFKRACRELK